MSEKIVPVDHAHHAKLKVDNKAMHTLFSNDHVIPVLVREFVGVAAQFPIVFVRNENSQQLHAVAMMGLKRGENLYCQDDKWSALYLPQSMRNAPFSIGPKSEGAEELAVCIDENHPLVGTDKEFALYDEQGEQTEFLQARSKAIASYINDTQQTMKFIALLEQHDLLSPRDMQIKMNNGEELTIGGILGIDEEKLSQLDTEVFNTLRQQGLLAPIYAQLFSMQQIHRLTALYMQKHG
ncbi:SapC family protein [Lacimicrobium sp. SS2-24]|uniref:SapC family protein n=1 Tax=Lacimicrobium sp. SS2-24 TaxID=2005569 RepID=UPI001439B2A7|nr:SapC family protein [Lacimicrobium sp. SS2-24]